MRSFATCLLVLLLCACPGEPRAMEVELSVEGMTCESCVEGISYEVGRLEGVRSVVVDLDAGKATVVFTEGVIAPAAIETTIDEMGYEAELAGAPSVHAPE